MREVKGILITWCIASFNKKDIRGPLNTNSINPNQVFRESRDLGNHHQLRKGSGEMITLLQVNYQQRFV